MVEVQHTIIVRFWFLPSLGSCLGPCLGFSWVTKGPNHYSWLMIIVIVWKPKKVETKENWEMSMFANFSSLVSPPVPRVWGPALATHWHWWECLCLHVAHVTNHKYLHLSHHSLHSGTQCSLPGHPGERIWDFNCLSWGLTRVKEKT